jgi:hypothetical protein
MGNFPGGVAHPRHGARITGSVFAQLLTIDGIGIGIGVREPREQRRQGDVRSAAG